MSKDAPRFSQPKLDDEVGRVAALHRYQVLDTPAEEAFDRITRLVTSALSAPMSGVALVAEDRRWFKSVNGGKRGSLPREQSFCNHTIRSADPTVVVDTLDDVRFVSNPLVVDGPRIRAYLGVPLATPEGYQIGSLCCVDTKPRDFSDTEISMMQDLARIVIDQMEMRQLALVDQLTSVLSRRGFVQAAEQGLNQARALDAPFAALVGDIDYFKSINDSHGHAVGDEVLIAFGDRLRAFAAEAQDVEAVGRLGGEEFGVALRGAPLQQAVIRAEALCKLIAARPFETSAGPLAVTISLGVGAPSGPESTLDDVLMRADEGLYRAKRSGRNRVGAVS